MVWETLDSYAVRGIRKDIRQLLLGEMSVTLNEVWVTEAELIRIYPFFTKHWLRRYGYTLPRTRAIVVDNEGNECKTSWGYGKNQIQQMIFDDRIRYLKVETLEPYKHDTVATVKDAEDSEG